MNAVNHFLRDQNGAIYTEGTCLLHDRWTKCVNEGGDYVEKIIRKTGRREDFVSCVCVCGGGGGGALADHDTSRLLNTFIIIVVVVVFIILLFIYFSIYYVTTPIIIR